MRRVSHSGNCTWYEFAKEIIYQTRGSVKVIPVDSNYNKRLALRPTYSVMDSARYFKVTEKKICTWQEALGEYLKLEDGSN